MAAEIIDGKAIAAKLRAELAEKISKIVAGGKRPPGLAVVLIGTDPASELYVKHKRRACAELGINSQVFNLPDSIGEAELLKLISKLNRDATVDGILVQLPLPQHINEQSVLEAIDPNKDVDGFHPYNLGRLAQRQPLLRSCTPYGVIQILAAIGIEISGLQATVVGASRIVGLPMSLELINAGATVTVCRSTTKELALHVKTADLLIVAIGKANIVRSEWIKPGAVVIDVGIHRDHANKLHGDIDFASAKEIAGWITPVPGGVGPMTITTLLQNTVQAYNA